MTRKEVLEYISSLDGWLSSHEGFFLYKRAGEISVKQPSPQSSRATLTPTLSLTSRARENMELSHSVGDHGKDSIVVEIGSWMGKSTICLAAGLMNGNGGIVYAVDPHKGEYTKNNTVGKKAPTFKKFKDNLQKAGVLQVVKPLITTSENAAKKWKSSIDFLFIDGLHDYKNTQLDFSLWSSFLTKGGTVAFHDAFCGYRGPEKVVVEKVLFNNTWSGIGVVGSIIYAKKGKARNMLQQINVFRHRLLIPFALQLHKTHFPHSLKFFLIHRIIKFLLLNRYTWQLQFEK